MKGKLLEPSIWSIELPDLLDNPSMDVHALRSSLALVLRDAHEADRGDVAAQQRVEEMWIRLGELWLATGDTTQGLTLFTFALEVAEKLSALFPGNLGIVERVTGHLERIGEVYQVLGNMDLALKFFSRSLETWQNSMHNVEDQNQCLLKQRTPLNRIAYIHERTGNICEAITFVEADLNLQRLAADTKTPGIDRYFDLLSTYWSLGSLLERLPNRRCDALSAYKSAMDVLLFLDDEGMLTARDTQSKQALREAILRLSN